MAKFRVVLDTPDGEQTVTVTAADEAEAGSAAQKIAAAKKRVGEAFTGAVEDLRQPLGYDAGEGIGRKLHEALSISDTFKGVRQAKELYGLEGENMGQQDRLRHLLWMLTMANRKSPEFALAARAAHEVQGLFDPVAIALRGRRQGAPWGDIGRDVLSNLQDIPRDLRTNLSAIAASNNPENPAAGSAPPNLNQLVNQALLTPKSRDPLTGQTIAGPVMPFDQNSVDLLSQYRKYSSMEDPSQHPLANIFAGLGRGPRSR